MSADKQIGTTPEALGKMLCQQRFPSNPRRIQRRFHCLSGPLRTHPILDEKLHVEDRFAESRNPLASVVISELRCATHLEIGRRFEGPRLRLHKDGKVKLERCYFFQGSIPSFACS